MTKRSFSKRIGYDALRLLCRLVGVLFFRVRCKRRHLQPSSGGGLICANHQSFFDPVLVGIAFQRRLNYLARQSLFRHTAFRWLIDFLDAIPLDREGSGLSGLKESLKRLRRGELVVIFPEGTRSTDGELRPLKPGFIALARRGKAPLIPVAIDGAYQAWPRTARWPRRSVIHVVTGEAMSPELVAELSDEELLDELEVRIAEAFEIARAQKAPDKRDNLVPIFLH